MRSRTLWGEWSWELTVRVDDREDVEVVLVDVRLDGGVRAVFGQEVVCNVFHNLRSVSI